MLDRLPSASQPIEEMIDRLNAQTVFGEPTSAGDATVIPVAEVSMGFGYGSGSGSRTDQTVGGGGSGGGGGGRARPVGYIEVRPEGVVYRPIIDRPRLMVSFFTLIAWNVFWIFRAMGRGGKQ
jgi:uncharacterized spore protein YtfJ